MSRVVAIPRQFVEHHRLTHPEAVGDGLLRPTLMVQLDMIALFARQLHVALGHGSFRFVALEILPYVADAFFHILTLGSSLPSVNGRYELRSLLGDTVLNGTHQSTQFLRINTHSLNSEVFVAEFNTGVRTSVYCTDVSEKLADLGIRKSTDLLILPRNFQELDSHSDLDFLDKTDWILKQLESNGVPVSKLSLPNNKARVLHLASMDWFLPTLYISALTLSQHPDIIQLAITCIRDYINAIAGSRAVNARIEIVKENETTGEYNSFLLLWSSRQYVEYSGRDQCLWSEHGIS